MTSIFRRELGLDVVLGDKIPRLGSPPSVIGRVSTSPAGNVALHIGRANSAAETGWHKTEHVALKPDEARTLAAHLLAVTGDPDEPAAPANDVTTVAQQLARLIHAFTHTLDHIDALQSRTTALEDRVSALTEHVVELTTREEETTPAA